MKWKNFRLFEIILVSVIVVNFNSCGGEDGKIQVESEGLKEVLNLEIEDEKVDFLRKNEEIVNIEEVDITHDGIKDKVVTSLYYGGDDREEISMNEKWKRGMCYVRIYDGIQVLEDGLHSKRDCIWERSYGYPHVGNGQLYLLNWNGEDFLINNSDYMSGGNAAFEFTVFFFTDSGEVIEKEGKSLIFCLDVNLAERPGIPVDEAVEYTKCLDEWLKDSELLVYFSVLGEPRIRTFDEECSATADEIWNWISDSMTEITMENLYDVLTIYNENLYGCLPEKTEIE